MAVLKKGSQDVILNEISGKIGDLYIRHQNGKPIICAMPKKRGKCLTSIKVAAENKFSTVSKYASFLNKIPELYAVWKLANLQGATPYHKMIKNNIKLILPEHPTVNNIITPPGFQIRIKDVVFLEDNFMIFMEDWFQPDTNDKCIMIMMLYDPLKSTSSAIELIDISPEGSDLVVKLSWENLYRLHKYKNFILYTAVIRMLNGLLQWSNTLPLSGELVP